MLHRGSVYAIKVGRIIAFEGPLRACFFQGYIKISASFSRGEWRYEHNKKLFALRSRLTYKKAEGARQTLQFFLGCSASKGLQQELLQNLLGSWTKKKWYEA